MDMDDKVEIAKAFVKGAALHAAATAYWVRRGEYVPTPLDEFIEERIEQYCHAYAKHGRAGREWAAWDPVWVSLIGAVHEAAYYAGLEPPSKQHLEAALDRHGLRPDTLLCDAAGLAAEVATAALSAES
jgi:hypothetical protein